VKPNYAENRETDWFGTWEFTEGETRRCRIGPFTLWLRFGDGEWRLCGKIGVDRLDPSQEPWVPDDLPADEDCTLGPLRMGFGSAGGRVTLAPVCHRSSAPPGCALAMRLFTCVEDSAPIWAATLQRTML